MDTNENTRNNASEDVIVLGVASIETQGNPTDLGELHGSIPTLGISED